MEEAESAIATSSGMAAILSTCMALLQVGDHVLCSCSVFGTTTMLLSKYLQKFGVAVTFVARTDYDAWEAAFQLNTRLVFVETPSNPLCEIVDIQRLATLSHAHDCLLVVDNCFCTPALQRPLTLGADLVVHKQLSDRKSTRLNSSHVAISYAVFCLKKKRNPSFSSG